MKQLRPGSEMCEEAHNLLDPMRTSLLLLGKAELGTAFHVDRTQAENIAFSVATKPKIVALNNLDIDFLILHIACLC